MRTLAVWLLALGLVWNPVVAGAATGDEKDASTPNKPEAGAGAAKKSLETPKTAEGAPKPTPSLEVEIQELKALIQAQAQELAAQREALRQQQGKTEALMKQLSGVPAPTSAPPSEAAMPRTVAATPAPVHAALSSPKSESVAAQGAKKEEEGPASIKFKGITLTPGGFFAAETTWRNRGLVADDNTPFNTVPFGGSSQARLSEFNAGGRQSRITMLIEGKAANTKFSGYYEADFLGAGTTSNNNQSNSYVFRQRQFWGQAALNNGVTFTGGQMWRMRTDG